MPLVAGYTTLYSELVHFIPFVLVHNVMKIFQYNIQIFLHFSNNSQIWFRELILLVFIFYF